MLSALFCKVRGLPIVGRCVTLFSNGGALGVSLARVATIDQIVVILWVLRGAGPC